MNKINEVIVTKKLFELGVPADLAGFNFLKDAVLLGLDEKVLRFGELCECVAIRRTTTKAKVERSIRHVIAVSPNMDQLPLNGRKNLGNVIGTIIQVLKIS